MKIIEPGHIYEMDLFSGVDGKRTTSTAEGVVTFFNREPGKEHSGTQTQELIRVAINRTEYLNGKLVSEFDPLILHHLRMALGLYEARALVRKVEKGKLAPEALATGKDGHYIMLPADAVKADPVVVEVAVEPFVSPPLSTNVTLRGKQQLPDLPKRHPERYT